MTYRTVDVDDLPNAPNPTTAKKEVDEALGVESFGFNVYTVAPGERVPWGFHSHPRHEEVFYVLDGVLTVDTAGEPIVVEAGEALRVPPGHPNRARNAGETSVRLIAVGAPKETDEAVIEERCASCGEVTDRRSERTDDGDTVVLRCAGCGVETDRFGRGPTPAE
ncbi:cupin domain-containing protein [Salinigranum sp. GCM10025319]|uniref:cupin domain-containing protein n=1 Tax=Salinigranum sp. GCM10025319 TaxID=3252687 RepID=UPI00361E8A8A